MSSAYIIGFRLNINRLSAGELSAMVSASRVEFSCRAMLELRLS